MAFFVVGTDRDLLTNIMKIFANLINLLVDLVVHCAYLHFTGFIEMGFLNLFRAFTDMFKLF